MAALLLASCRGSAPSSRGPLAPPEENTTLGPGDVFMMQIVGEKDLPEEYQVASDGTVDFPYIQTLKVSGHEPQEVARMVRQRLIEDQILKDPSVVVRVTEYRSKRITVLGQVQKPGSFSYQTGMTLVQAISLAGGLSTLATHDKVRLTRRGKEGKSNTVIVDLNAINSGDAEDILLQAGDRIYVAERLF